MAGFFARLFPARLPDTEVDEEEITYAVSIQASLYDDYTQSHNVRHGAYALTCSARDIDKRAQALVDEEFPDASGYILKSYAVWAT